MFLNLSEYCVEKPQPDVKQIYELFGVVVHEGSISTGHYTVYIKNSGHWYKCDDSVVSLVNQDEVLNSNAYLLFTFYRFNINLHEKERDLSSSLPNKISFLLFYFLIHFSVKCRHFCDWMVTL